MHTMPPLRLVQINRLVLETVENKQLFLVCIIASAVESKFTGRDYENMSIVRRVY